MNNSRLNSERRRKNIEGAKVAFPSTNTILAIGRNRMGGASSLADRIAFEKLAVLFDFKVHPIVAVLSHQTIASH